MSACREFRDLISAHLDGELDPAEAAALEAHLAGCADCARALEDLRATVARIRSLEPVEPPPDLAERILARVGAAPRRRSLASRPWIQAAALVFIAFSGYVLTRIAGPARAIAPPALPVPAAPALQEAPGEAPEVRQAPAAQAAPKARRAPAAQDAAPAVRELEAPRLEPPAAKEAAAPPAPVASGAAVRDQLENRARKAEVRALAAKAAPAPPARVAFRLEVPDPGKAAQAALRRCGGELLPPGERAVSARMESARLPELRALLAREGKVEGDVPGDLPPEVVVTISW